MSNSLQNHVGVGKESSFGVAVSPSAFLITKEVKGMSTDMDKKFVEGIVGTAPKNKSAFNGLSVMNGEYEMDLYPQTPVHVFRSAIGAPTTALKYGESAVYVHTFKESFTKPSYTVEEKFGEIIERYSGFRAKNTTVEVKKGETVNLKFGGMAQGQADNAGATPSYETTRPFNFKDISTLSIGAVSILPYAEEVSFEYDNGLYARHAIGDNALKDLIPGKSEHKGKITLYLDSTTKDFLADYIANTERSIEMIMEGASIGTSSKNAFRIYIAKAQFSSVGKEIADNYNALSIDFEAVEDATNGIIVTEFTNTLSSI